MTVRIEPITAANWRQAVALRVADGQERYVASNVTSIAESKVHPYREVFAIYDGDVMVGFTMFGREPDDGCDWISRLMIDREHQGRGYGRAAMEAVLRALRTRPGCREIRIGFVPENVAARGLYLSLGFEDRGEVVDGEVVLTMRVDGGAGPEGLSPVPVPSA